MQRPIENTVRNSFLRLSVYVISLSLKFSVSCFIAAEEGSLLKGRLNLHVSIYVLSFIAGVGLLNPAGSL